ncbi:MAG: bacteriophage abortive infection AbiH family protein [Roseburia sp.]|nr:bacteriophage abortive infection AbiH family protein [Roseburia sp.]
MKILRVPERNILVLGNGFDLHHNMKTKYSHYIEFMRELRRTNIRVAEEAGEQKFVLQKKSQQIYRDNGFSEEAIEKIWSTIGNGFVQYFMSYGNIVKGWIDFEVLIKSITVDIEEMMNKLDAMPEAIDKYDKNITWTDREVLLAESFDKIFRTRMDKKIWIKEEFKNNLTGIDRKEVRKILRKEYDGLCESLWIYLKEIEPYCRTVKTELTYRQIEEIQADMVITFNYTDTYKRYGIEPEDAIHVHGSLEEKNIVLGFQDDNETELQYVYFKKYMQCILKHTPILENYSFRRKIEKGEEDSQLLYDEIIMHFFGHSLDITDRDMLSLLFDRASRIKIYYYDEDDYEEKIEKVIDMLGKKKALQKIHEKNIDFILIEKTGEEKAAESESERCVLEK